MRSSRDRSWFHNGQAADSIYYQPCRKCVDAICDKQAPHLRHFRTWYCTSLDSVDSNFISSSAPSFDFWARLWGSCVALCPFYTSIWKMWNEEELSLTIHLLFSDVFHVVNNSMAQATLPFSNQQSLHPKVVIFLAKQYLLLYYPPNENAGWSLTVLDIFLNLL